MRTYNFASLLPIITLWLVTFGGIFYLMESYFVAAAKTYGL